MQPRQKQKQITAAQALKKRAHVSFFFFRSSFASPFSDTQLPGGKVGERRERNVLGGIAAVVFRFGQGSHVAAWAIDRRGAFA